MFFTEPLQRFDLVENVIGQLRLLPVQARPLGRGLPAMVLAREQPICQRKIRQKADTAMHAGRYDFPFSITLQQTVVILGGDEPSLMFSPGNPVGVGDLPPGEVRRPDVTHFAFRDEIVKCRQGLRERSNAIRRVVLVEVYVVSLQTA